MEEIVEGSGEENRAIPAKDMKNWAGKEKVRSLNYLGTSELEDGVDGENNLKKGEGFRWRVTLKDMSTPHSQEGRIFGSVRE